MIEYSWDDLIYEINSNIDIGLPVEFWWRNDGVYSKSNDLRQLSSLASNEGVPVAISVIPEKMRDDIVFHIKNFDNHFVIQHGYAHKNHAHISEQKNELSLNRPIKDSLKDLSIGFRNLSSEFECKFLPILVPPWNRLSTQIIPHLNSLGLMGLSCLGGRNFPNPVSNIFQTNTHIDLIDWKGTNRFIGTGAAIAFACKHLSDKRNGKADPFEPTGLLTHHMRMDFSSWAFIGTFIRKTKTISDVQWPSIQDIFKDRSIV
ncbi:MAG: hypothetical protein CMM30_03140 [Rhodospirillaceae bacterium]|nr:hypothetical protein [Rhodospirillaceae bacterium]